MDSLPAGWLSSAVSTQSTDDELLPHRKGAKHPEGWLTHMQDLRGNQPRRPLSLITGARGAINPRLGRPMSLDKGEGGPFRPVSGNYISFIKHRFEVAHCTSRSLYRGAVKAPADQLFW